MLIFVLLISTIIVNFLVMVFCLRINSNFMAKILEDAENRIDKKLKLEKLVRNGFHK